MALLYTAERHIIEATLEKLKADGGVAPDARFDYGSFQKLRQEVLYRDLDFLHMAEQRPLGTAGRPEDEERLPDRDRVELALTRLKRTGFVAQEARLNAKEPRKLAQEVFYRDLHFLYYLGLYAEREITAAALALLKREGLVAANAAYEPDAFERLRQEVKASFEVPDTAISPVMERLLYMFSALKRPRRALGIGIFCGNTLIWSVGASCNGGRVYEAEKVYGVDIDAQAIAQARKNLARLQGVEHIELLVEDGRATAERLAGPFDYVYLDADSPENSKGIYLELLQRLYPKLSPGAWVLAHDATLPSFKGRLEAYLRFVRDPHHFSQSITFDVDVFGLELSIK